MQLKRGLGVYPRSESQVQIGVDQRVRLDLELKSPGELEALLKLETMATLPEMRRLVSSQGGQSRRVATLIRQLTEAGCLAGKDTTQSPRWNIPTEHRESLSPEAETRGLVQTDGWAAAARRSRQRVSVYGLGRTGANLALDLACAGVGILQLYDPALVTGRDVGLVYRKQDIGQVRSTALAQIIDQAGLPSETRTSGRWAKPDVAVLTGYEVVDPQRAEFLTTHLVPHLPVVIDELSITCGPWVDPKTGPCVGCLHLHRTDLDPLWYRVATQQWSRCRVAKRGEDTTLAAMAAGFGAAQVVAALAGDQPSTIGQSATVTMPAYDLAWTKHQAHPNCQIHGGQKRSTSLATGWRPWAPPSSYVIRPAA